MSLSGKVALITGATGGAAGAVCLRMAETGARLVLTSRSAERLDRRIDELGLPAERTMRIAADLADAASVDALMGGIAEQWGGVDILVNLAGGWRGGQRLADVAVSDWDAVMDMNLRSAFLVNRAVLPHMADNKWGRIINIASRAAVNPGSRQAGYNVSKAGVVALTGSIAQDYRRRGVVANVILPSIIDTPQNRAQMPDADTSRWVTPDQIAAMVVYLCGAEAVALNGAAIPLYGRV